MRLLLAIAACGVIFFAVLWVGGRVFATGSSADAAAPRTFLSTTSVGDEGTTSSREKSGRQETTARSSRDPQVHHVHADMVIAGKAVLHASDIETEWVPVPPPKDAPPCRQNDPDLSRFTITGEGRTIFESPAGIARTESRVSLFANGGQATLYFQALNNEAKLRCIRDGVKGWLSGNGWKPRLLYAKMQTAPPIGAQTAIYLFNYAITLSTGRKLTYPVELLTFQVNRAVGTLEYNFIFSPDGRKPCQCELDEARLVSSRLYRT